MPQGYHTNATTNLHSREIIQQSSLSNTELAERFRINEKTVSKWKNRDHLEDKSSRPHTIKRSLTDIEREVIRVFTCNTGRTIYDIKENRIKNNVFGEVCTFKADHDFILYTLGNKGELSQN